MKSLQILLTLLLLPAIILPTVILPTVILPTVAAADSRLIGRWTLSNSELALPPGVALDIRQNGDSFEAFPSINAQIPAPYNCPIKNTDSLISITPTELDNRYTLDFSFYLPTSCIKSKLSSITATILFAQDNKSFSACDDSAVCTNWTNIPNTISNKTIPLPTIAYGGKKSISISWNSVGSAYAYRVSIKSPKTFLQRTVKNGRFTKFIKLPAGNYKVSFVAFFKDSAGKSATTKSSPAVKCKVT